VPTQVSKLVVAAGIVVLQTLGHLGVQQAASPSPSPSSSSAQALPADLYLGGSFPAVTPSQAKRIVTAWWPLHESALAGNDIALTDALEGGSSREYDDAVSRDNIARGGNLRVVRLQSRAALRCPAPIPGWIAPKDVPGRLAAYWSYCYEYGPPTLHGPWRSGVLPVEDEHLGVRRAWRVIGRGAVHGCVGWTRRLLVLVTACRDHRDERLRGGGDNRAGRHRADSSPAQPGAPGSTRRSS